MTQSYDELQKRIETLLVDPANQDHPLADAVKELCRHLDEHMRRLERITMLSDSYQSMVLERETDLCNRFEHQLRRIGRIMRISDRYQGMLRDANLRLQEVSNLDPLTGVPNRRVLMTRLQEASQLAAEGDFSFVVGMLDIDHFKAINDHYGHQTGDRALVTVARSLCSDLRATDLCGRWGGEEFLLLLPNVSPADARTILERKLAAIRGLQIDTGHGKTLNLTMSAGLAEHDVDEAISSTINRADAALYLAKRQGRDQVAP